MRHVKRPRRLHRVGAALGAVVAMIAGPAIASPAVAGNAGAVSRLPGGRYLVDGPLPSGVAALGQYGTTSLADLTPTQAALLRAGAVRLELLPDAHLLKLNWTTIDTSAAPPQLPAQLAASAAPTSWIVQFVGPAADGWMDAVRAAGLRPVAHGYVPENGWLVRGRADAAGRVLRLPFVQAALPYAPAYRISPRLDGRTGVAELRVLLFDDADVATMAAKLTGLGATVRGRIDAADVKLLHVDLTTTALPALARLDGVEWIEPAVPLRLSNDHADDTLGLRSIRNGVRDAPNLVLRGAGEIAAVADTGLDTGDPATIHPDFRDHIVDLQAWGRPGPGGDLHAGDPSDEDGHGTHTSGSVVGDGTAWSQINFTGCTASCNPAHAPAGMAPDAGLVFQSIADATGSLSGVPEDPGVLYGAAYAAGARIHSNSYGSDTAGVYDAQAFLADRFLETHPDMLIAFAAGNAGTDLGTPDGIIDLGSIGSPATAKDVLAVGASEDNRGPVFTSGDFGFGAPVYSTYAVFANGGPPFATDFMSNNRDGMVAFSSRGPALDGRIKPDVVAVGTHVLSTRSTLIPANQVFNHYWSEASNGSSNANGVTGDYPKTADPYYAFDGGTSMATPLAAGAATVVRQYLRQARGFASPSAALLRAVLTGGADEMLGQYPMPTPDVTARPDNNEGWGRVDVANAINPPGATKVALVDEPTGLRTGADAHYTFTVTDASVPLRVQLAWTDVAANLVAAKTLVNDLDLTVTAPDGTTYRGNKFDARSNGTTASTRNPVAGNHVDPTEGVTVLAPPAGTWTLDVRGFTVPSAPQSFGLVVRGGLASASVSSVHLDAAAYRSGGRRAQIVVTDPGATAAAVPVALQTSRMAAPVTVSLSRASGVPGMFTGAVAIGDATSAPSATSVPGADGDRLTVTYADSTAATRAATATIDNRPPVVTGVASGVVAPFAASVSFLTDEPATGTADFAESPAGATVVSGRDRALVTNRTVTALGLAGAKRYYYSVSGADDPGNTARNDNGGARYTLRTPAATLEYAYDAETENGWTHRSLTGDAVTPGDDEWHLTSRADAVHGGSHAWLFGPEDPGATYASDSDAVLESPAITRHASAWSTLELFANYETEKGFDGLNFLASDDGGSTYRLIPLVTISEASPPELAAQVDGKSGGWRKLTFDLSGFSNSTLRLRIEFTSDSGVEFSGAAIDDVSIFGSQASPASATVAFAPSGASPARGTSTMLGQITVTPDRDWVRATHLVVRRSGNATDAEVPAAEVVAGGRTYRAPFVNAVAIFDGLILDASPSAPGTAQLGVDITPTANTNHTVGLLFSSQSVQVAAPDTVTDTGDYSVTPHPIVL